jgi:CrcB protein
VTALGWVAVGLVGAVGALSRFGLDHWITRRRPTPLPIGTLVVNLSGALVLGLLVGAGAAGETLRIAGTASLGAYTTFSTWMLESQRLAEDGRAWLAAANLVVSLLGGLAAVAVGRAIGQLL